MKLPFNPGNKTARIGVTVVVLLLIAGLATTCRSESNVTFSYGKTLVRGQTDALDITIVNDNGPGDASLGFGATFIGESHYWERQPPNFFIHADLIEGFKRFDVSLGISYAQNDDRFNTGRAQFTLGLGYRLKRFPITLSYRHYSNGGTKMPNVGRDIAFLGWRF